MGEDLVILESPSRDSMCLPSRHVGSPPQGHLSWNPSRVDCCQKPIIPSYFQRCVASGRRHSSSQSACPCCFGTCGWDGSIDEYGFIECLRRDLSIERIRLPWSSVLSTCHAWRESFSSSVFMVQGLECDAVCRTVVIAEGRGVG